MVPTASWVRCLDDFCRGLEDFFEQFTTSIGNGSPNGWLLITHDLVSRMQHDEEFGREHQQRVKLCGNVLGNITVLFRRNQKSFETKTTFQFFTEIGQIATTDPDLFVEVVDEAATVVESKLTEIYTQWYGDEHAERGQNARDRFIINSFRTGIGEVVHTEDPTKHTETRDRLVVEGSERIQQRADEPKLVEYYLKVSLAVRSSDTDQVVNTELSDLLATQLATTLTSDGFKRYYQEVLERDFETERCRQLLTPLWNARTELEHGESYSISVSAGVYLCALQLDNDHEARPSELRNSKEYLTEPARCLLNTLVAGKLPDAISLESLEIDEEEDTERLALEIKTYRDLAADISGTK